MNLAALKTEIESGPLAAELSPFVADVFVSDPDRPQLDFRVGQLRPDAAARIADILNTRNRSGRRVLNLWEVKLHCVQHGCWPKIRGAAQSHPVAEIKAVAQTVLDYVDDQRFTTIDIDNAASQTMLGALVAGSVLTSEETEDISSLADTLISRAEELALVAPGHDVTFQFVLDAMNGGD